MKEAQGLSFSELSYILGVLLEAGLETTTGILEFFTMASILYPESAGKAQDELDSVVGQNQLPSPYVNAFIKEVFRWRPGTPMSVPHSSLKDDEYKGYHIPKGATIIENQWAINLNDNHFQDPYEFIPERWLQYPDQPLSIFGFGRRTCPGKHMGQNSIFIAIARILWAYNISHQGFYQYGRFQYSASYCTYHTAWVGASYCTNWYRATGTSTVLVRYRYNCIHIT
jgi:cytochrome P450